MLGLAASVVAGATGATVTLPASKDTTLYNFSPPTISNGAGEHFFAGANANGNARRGAIAFDLTSIPAGSVIESAVLRLHMSRTTGGVFDITLRRAVAEWGEGASDAPDEEGQGAPAEPGDATWAHRFYPSVLWTMPGGDIAPDPGATTLVGGVGTYDFTDSSLAAAVQLWLDNPASNFGWIIIGEESGSRTAKRFDSRENVVAENRPQLIVTFQPPACHGDADGNGAVGLSDIAAVIICWGLSAACDPAADLDASGDIGLGDVAMAIGHWGQTCP